MSWNNLGTAAFIFLDKKILLLYQGRVGYWEQKKKSRAPCKHLSIIPSQTSSWFAFQHRKHIFWPGMENTEHSMEGMGTAPSVNPLQGRQGLGHAAGKREFWRWCLLPDSQGSKGSAKLPSTQVCEVIEDIFWWEKEEDTSQKKRYKFGQALVCLSNCVGSSSSFQIVVFQAASCPADLFCGVTLVHLKTIAHFPNCCIGC